MYLAFLDDGEPQESRASSQTYCVGDDHQAVRDAAESPKFGLLLSVREGRGADRNAADEGEVVDQTG